MSEPQNKDESSAKPGEAVPPQGRDSNPSAPGDQPASGELTKEEQWALFEKELKESDWGHQPC
jgi:hypothetical protein